MQVPHVQSISSIQRRADQAKNHVGTSTIDIWAYHFKTVNASGTVATWVEYVPNGGTNYQDAVKYGAKRLLQVPERGFEITLQ